MKKAVMFLAVLVLAGGLVVEVTHLASDKFLTKKAGENDIHCSHLGQNHVVTILDSKLQPSSIYGKRCDTLTILNKDDVTREMAFGEHDQHTAYNGIVERVLTKDKSLTITLDRSGEFIFHDHIQDSVQGTFLVTN